MTTIDTIIELNKVYHRALLDGNADVLTYYNSVNNLIIKEVELVNFQQLYVDQYITLEILAGKFLNSDYEGATE